jgi:NAD(P)H dehydrogenase (quinone)
MKVLVVYAHPSEDSFTSKVRDTVIENLEKNGHEWVLSDLYKMGFKTDMSEEEYLREAYYKKDLPLAEDVKQEQEKIKECQGIIFVYPVFWTEAPAKLVGWFDRVWTCGFAYEPCTMPQLDTVLFFAIAGNTLERLESHGFAQAMEKVMCKDRISTRAKKCELHLLTETSRGMESREKLAPLHLERVAKRIKEL